MISATHFVVLGAIIFTIGAIGFLTRRNVIVALMSIELMLNAVNLTLVAFNRMHGHHTGQMFAFFIIAVAAAEAAVGLAIVLSLYRVRRTVRTDQADQLKGLGRDMESLFQTFPAHNFTLLGVILGMPLVAAFVNGLFGKRIGREGVRLMALAAMGTSFVAALITFFMLRSHAHHMGEHAGNPRLVWHVWNWLHLSATANPVHQISTTLKVQFAVDPLSGVMMLVVTGVGFLIHLYSSSYMWDDPGFYRFFAYLNLFVFSMLVLIFGDSMPLLFVGWEGVGLCSYLLIGFWFEEGANAAAGQKAFVANRVGDFGLLVGMAMLLYYTNSLSFSGIIENRSRLTDVIQIWPIPGGLPPWLAFMKPNAPFVVHASTLAGIFLFIGCCGKSAQIPLYVWLPDAMAGPTPVSALIHAATMVTAGIYLICRLNPVFIMSPAVMAIIAATGCATAFFAATIGLVQQDIKKVLAYSTVSQLGYMFLGVGVGGFSDGFFHVFTHAFFKACLFLGAGSVIHSMHTGIHDTDASQDMRNMGGLRKYLPYTHATYLISCLAISGVPLTAGFFSKDEILAKAWENTIKPAAARVPYWTPPAWFGKALFVVGVLAAAMTAFYMFRTYFLTFWGEFKGWKIVEGAEDHHDHDVHGHDDHHDHHHVDFEPGTGREHLEAPAPHESPWQMTVPLGVLAFMAIAGGYLNAGILAHTFHMHSLASLHHWLHPVFAGSEKFVQAAPFNAAHAWTMAIPGMLAAAGGIGFAYFAYQMSGGEPVRKLAEATGPVHRFLLDKWRVDEFYDATFVGAVDELASTSVQVDQWVVDGILAKLSSALVRALGFLLRLMQSGKSPAYAAVMVAGTLGIFAFFYMPRADYRIAGDPIVGKYEIRAAEGIGYTYRWDTDGDGKPDNEKFSAKKRVVFDVSENASRKITLEVRNAFGRVAKEIIEVKRPGKKPAPGLAARTGK